MYKLFWMSQILFAPEGDEGSFGGVDEADVDLLNSDEVEEVKDEDEPLVDEEEEEEKEPEEETEEEEEKEEEEEPEETYHPRPSITELKTAFPDLFKKFPVMKDIIFREQEFGKLFPTVDVARSAVENSDALESFQQALSEGDASTFAKALVEIDAVDKVAPNILGSLYSVSPEAYVAATTPAFEKAVKMMYAEGASSGNDNLANAALVMSKWLFGDLEIAKGTKTFAKVERKDPEVEKIKKEREEESNARYQEHHNEATETASKKLTSLIEDKLDPDEVLSPYMKRTIIKDCIEEVNAQIISDKQFINYMNNLWLEYRRSNYSGELKNRIISAFLLRAKPLIPGIRSRVTKEALGVAKKDSQNKGKRAAASGSKNVPAGATSKERGNFDSGKRVDYSQSSDEDIIAGNIKYRS